jgi:hypothetical protein
MKQLIKQFNDFVKSHGKDPNDYYDLEYYTKHNNDEELTELYIELYQLVQDDNEMNDIKN